MEKVRKWLKVYMNVMSVNSLEKRIGCPRGTIYRWMVYDKAMPEKWGKALELFLDEMVVSYGLVRINMGVAEPNIQLVGDPEKYKVLGTDKELHVQRVRFDQPDIADGTGPVNIAVDDPLRSAMAEGVEKAFEADKPKGRKKKEPKPKLTPGMIAGTEPVPEEIKKEMGENLDKMIALERKHDKPFDEAIKEERKEQKKLVWTFDSSLISPTKIDSWTNFENGFYEVWKWFGNRKKYALVDSLEKVQIIKDTHFTKALDLIL